MSLKNYEKEVEHLGESQGVKDHNHNMIYEQKLNLPEFNTYDSLLGKSNVATVSNGLDNGFLDGCAKAFKNVKRNGTTKQAIDNLNGSLGVLTTDAEEKETVLGLNEPWMAGHGNEGTFTTGIGQNGDFKVEKYVATWTQSNWEGEFKKLESRKYGILTILSCHTGAGEEGADLLYEIAKATNHPVRARTGFTYSNSSGKITYEKNSTWQVATPAERPNPIAAPTPHFGINDEIRFLTKNYKMQTISANDVTEVTFIPGEKIAANRRSFTLSADEAKGLVRLIGFAEPFNPEGEPGAVVTGQLKLSLIIEGQKQLRTFLIYNDRLVRDDTYPSIFYYVAPGFRAAIQVAR